MGVIFEKQIYSEDTGELTTIETHIKNKSKERFFMGRTTDGIEWMLEFDNRTQIILFIMMVELENLQNKYIIGFTKLQVQESALILKVSESMIRKSLSELEKKNFLVRIARGNYLANPMTFYKGGTESLKEKIANYDYYRSVK